MASVPDILGLTHIAATSVVQLVTLLKNQISNYRALSVLLDEAEGKLRRIDAMSLSLSRLAEVEQLDSDVFARAFSDVQDVERELVAVQLVIQNRTAAGTFLTSSRLYARLRDVNDKLSQVDRSFGLTAMVADVITRKVESECAILHSRFEGMSNQMNQMLSVLAKQDSSTDMTFQTLAGRESDKLTELGSLTCHRTMLSIESKAHIYFLLGKSYYNGEHERGINYSHAARFLHAALNGGINSATYYLGKLYLNGQGVRQCFETAFDYFQAGARNGDLESMHEVGWCYDFGHGTVIDARNAVKYYEMAAKGGSGSGMWCSGYHALHGNNCRRNWPKAVRLIQNARQAGETRANMELAQCYEYGIAVERDPRKTFELLNEAHESGDIMSIAYFARCYELEIGIERNLETAAALYKDAMSRGSWLSKLFQCYYGFFLIRGFGVRKNEHEGLRILRAGLKIGHGCGWALYGACYRFGYGVQKDAARAVRYYTKAIASPSGQRGVRNGHLALAEMYETGDGLERNMAKSVHHYIRAANRMDRIAQWKAGNFYETGTEVDEHIHHAFYYFDLSARSGHPQAMRKAGELYMKGLGIQRDRTKAVELLEEATKQGDTKARKMLRKARRSNLLSWSRRSTV